MSHRDSARSRRNPPAPRRRPAQPGNASVMSPCGWASPAAVSPCTADTALHGR
jgi:hypothetical protein